MLLLLTAGMTVACSSDNDVVEAPVNPDEVQTPITITANYGDPTTRVGYTEDGANISAKWETGDQLLVVFNNKVNTLTLNSGAGTSTATFKGTIDGAPAEGTTLLCYVKDKNTPAGAVTINGDGSYIYNSSALLNQDGTVGGAAKFNLYSGFTRYTSVANINCTLSVNTSIMKFTVNAPEGVTANTTNATLTYKSGETEITKATFTVGEGGMNTIYMAIPAGAYSGIQSLVYKSGATESTEVLSSSLANFVAGKTYSKTVEFRGTINLSTVSEGTEFTVPNGKTLTGTLAKSAKIQIAAGATVTLDGVDINDSGSLSYDCAGITCLGDATIILKSGTTSSVKGLAVSQPGIFVPWGSTLTIQGTGTLNAYSGGLFYTEIGESSYARGAGIGAQYHEHSGTGNEYSCGNIIIEGGTINAMGGRTSAGIGGSNNSNCGTITIAKTVTKVTASTLGNEGRYPIGGGELSGSGVITFGDVQVYNGSTWTSTPTSGTNYGGLTLLIGIDNLTWELTHTPSN